MLKHAKLIIIITNILTKIAGEATTDPLASYMLGKKVMGMLDIGVEKWAASLFSTIMRMPAYMKAFQLVSSPIAIVNFIYHFVVELVYRIVRASFTGVKPEAVFYLTMYDSQMELDNLVTRQNMQACAGLSLTLGYTNPWALFARYQCNSWAGILSNVVQFLNVFLVSFFENFLHQVE